MRSYLTSHIQENKNPLLLTARDFIPPIRETLIFLRE